MVVLVLAFVLVLFPFVVQVLVLSFVFADILTILPV